MLDVIWLVVELYTVTHLKKYARQNGFIFPNFWGENVWNIWNHQQSDLSAINVFPLINCNWFQLPIHKSALWKKLGTMGGFLFTCQTSASSEAKGWYRPSISRSFRPSAALCRTSKWYALLGEIMWHEGRKLNPGFLRQSTSSWIKTNSRFYLLHLLNASKCFRIT